MVLNALTGESQLLSLDPNTEDSNSYCYLMATVQTAGKLVQNGR